MKHLAILILLFAPLGLLAAGPDAQADGAMVSLSVADAGPRHIESTLQQSISRDYKSAWQTLNQSLQTGNPEALNQYWVGTAFDKFKQLVADESRTGVQVRYLDKSHRLQAVFYPIDGAAMLLHDDAEVEVQVLQSGKVIHSESLTQHYVVLMTPAQDRWMVRVFQSAAAQ